MTPSGQSPQPGPHALVACVFEPKGPREMARGQDGRIFKNHLQMLDKPGLEVTPRVVAGVCVLFNTSSVQRNSRDHDVWSTRFQEQEAVPAARAATAIAGTHGSFLKE